MKVSQFAVKHPVVIGMLLIVLGVFGILSVSSINVEFMGDISMPSVIVVAIYPGADAQDMEEDVTSILEDDFVTLPDFKSISSESANSVCTITITFRDGIDPYDRVTEVRDRINRLMPDLPQGLSGTPVVLVGGAEMLPVFSFSVSGGEDQGAVTNYVENTLKPRLTSIAGVSSVEVSGGSNLRVNVKLRVEDLASKEISALNVYQILGYSNVSLPAGSVVYNDENIAIRYRGELTSLEDIRQLPVGSTEDGIIIRLQDVADVTFDYPEPETYVTDGKNPLILVEVKKRSDGNTMTIAKTIKDILAESEAEIGGAITYNIIGDDSRTISASMSTVIQSGIGGIVMAVLVIFLFLTDFRATLIIGLSIPLSILFTFVAMKLFGVTVNLMSLSGIVVALGMVVDGSIVMLEQVYRYYGERDSEGKLRYSVSEAIFKGSGEVGASIFASTATTVVVFVPIAVLSGIVGMILRDVSLTLIMALTASYISAVILVPFLMNLFLKDTGPKNRVTFVHRGINWLEEKYKKMLRWSLKSWKFFVFLSCVVLLATLFILQSLGITFVPSTDNSDFYINLEYPSGFTLEKTKANTEEVVSLLYKNVPEVQTAVSFIGAVENFGSAQQQTNASYIHVVLVPVAERERDIHTIILQMQNVITSEIPGVAVEVTNGGFDKLLGYVTGGGGYGLTFVGEDIDLLYDTAVSFKNFLQQDKEVVTVKMNTSMDAQALTMDMVHEYMSSVGISSYEAGITATILFQGMNVGRFRSIEDDNRYDIYLYSDKKNSVFTPDDLTDIQVISAAGAPVSFASIGDIRKENTLSKINRQDRAKTITVSARLISEDTSGVNSRVQEWLKKNPLPTGITSKSGGVMELIEDSIPSVVMALAVAWFLVYTVMVLQFERFRQPLIVMATIPFCLIGIVIGLLIFGSSMNLVAFLGVISLGGVVVNNGIILIDYINLLREQRKDEEDQESVLQEAVISGSASRIRPIFMTTLTTMLGVVPMAIAKGEGAEIYAPLGQAIAGGLLTSTLITLFVIPVLYYITERRRHMKSEKNSLIKVSLLLITLSLLVSVPKGYAQSSSTGKSPLPRLTYSGEKLTLNDLVLSMEENNVDLKKAQENLNKALLDVKDAKGNYQPQIDFIGGSMYMFNPPIDEITLKQGSLNGAIGDVSSIPVLSGINIPVQDVVVYEGMPNWYYAFMVNIQQPIYTWGKISNGVKIYSNVADVQALQLSSQKKQLKVSLEASAVALYYLTEIEKLLTQQQKYVDELVVLSEDGLKQGVLLKQDVLEAKTQAALIPVTMSEIESNKDSVLEELRRITGLPNLTGDMIAVLPDEDFYKQMTEQKLEDLEALALNPEKDTFVMLDKMVEVSSDAQKVAKASIYGKPDIALNLGLGFQGDMQKLFKGDLSWQENTSANITLIIKTTLWDGGKILNDVKRAGSDINTAVYEKEAAISTVKQELYKQYNSMNLANLKIEYQKLKIETAQSQLEQAQKLQNSGYGSKRDILQAQITKTTEEITLLQEKINLATAVHTIEALATL